MNYWMNREERAKAASAQVAKMCVLYTNEITDSRINSLIYTNSDVADISKINTNRFPDKANLSIVKNTSDGILLKIDPEEAGKIAVLNFASYKNPGGQFLNGSNAQEEALCHHSSLFNVLISFDSSFYKNNRANVNRALYKNRAIYSPKIVFHEKMFSDVITCAAPNKGAAMEYAGVDSAECDAIMKNRIFFVLKIAADQEVDTLVLGAYGCGVFKNDKKFVAQTFKDYLTGTFKNTFKNVYFPIPDDETYNIFKRVIQR